MDKPQLLIEVEFRQKFSELINEYVGQIPALHLLDVMSDTSRQLSQLSEKQIAEAREIYEKEGEEGWQRQKEE